MCNSWRFSVAIFIFTLIFFILIFALVLFSHIFILLFSKICFILLLVIFLSFEQGPVLLGIVVSQESVPLLFIEDSEVFGQDEDIKQLLSLPQHLQLVSSHYWFKYFINKWPHEGICRAAL